MEPDCADGEVGCEDGEGVEEWWCGSRCVAEAVAGVFGVSDFDASASSVLGGRWRSGVGLRVLGDVQGDGA